jgi:hypothetical protein
MYPAVTISLASLVIACVIGIIVLIGKREIARRKRERQERLKRRVKELTGQDFVKGYTSVEDLERMYGKKG